MQCEGIDEPTEEDVRSREQVTRSKVSRLIPHADARVDDPLGRESRGGYRTVISAYCADSIKSDKEVWAAYMRNIGSLVAPGGHFIISALGSSDGYRVKGKAFPSSNIHKEDMIRVLESELIYHNIDVIEVSGLGEHEQLGYTSVILAQAVRSI